MHLALVVVLIDIYIDCFIFDLRSIYDMFIAYFVEMYVWHVYSYVYLSCILCFSYNVLVV
jgi:hypothetical protein